MLVPRNGFELPPHSSSLPTTWFFLLVVPLGVGNPPKPLSDVRCADARSAKIRSPNGVTRCFKVSAYKVEPPKAIFARNLLSKDD
jgi:hypothetical protein